MNMSFFAEIGFFLTNLYMWKPQIPISLAQNVFFFFFAVWMNWLLCWSNRTGPSMCFEPEDQD